MDLLEKEEIIEIKKEKIRNKSKKFRKERKEILEKIYNIIGLDKLNKHYLQMMDDASYLKRLKLFKPKFLKTLDNMNKKVLKLDKTIQEQIIESNDKVKLRSLLDEIRLHIQNKTSELSKTFLEHYQKFLIDLVLETYATGATFFPTEKTLRPIIAKTPFIIFGPSGYLENMRRIGFKTFNNVIDESYDLEPDHNKRWKMAMDQLKILCNSDPIKIHKKIQSTVEHNQKLMLTYDWYGEFTFQLKSVLDPYLTSDHTIVD